jgi:SPP1 family predicted phage head-tail adaptor
MLDPGELFHRIDIEKRVQQVDSSTGLSSTVWLSFATDVPAKVTPVSVRDFLASQAMQSQIVARIVIRRREGLTADMRIKFRGQVYNPAGWLPDPDSGLEYLTAPCSMGTNAG